MDFLGNEAIQLLFIQTWFCALIFIKFIYINIKSFVKYCLICKLLRIISSTKENKLITVHIMYRRVYIDTWACIIRCCRTGAWGDCLPDELLQCLPKDATPCLLSVFECDDCWYLSMINKIDLVQSHAAQDLLRQFLLFLCLHSEISQNNVSEN